MVRGPLTVVASPIAEHRLRMRRLSGRGSRAQPLRGMRDPPGPGHEPVYPALGGRFLTTVPSGKSSPNMVFFFVFFFLFFFLRYAGLSLLWPLPLRTQGPDAQAQRPWLTGPAAPRHAGSSRTGARTRDPAPAGGLPTTAPPGKPPLVTFVNILFTMVAS